MVMTQKFEVMCDVLEISISGNCAKRFVIEDYNY